jgi:hypothetical protein
MVIRVLGKREARHDHRLPHFSLVTAFPDPPDSSNWYADVPEWGELGNLDVGDCVVAAAMHCIMQGSAYANPGKGLIGSTSEAIASYSAIGGYVRGNLATDQGLFVAGPGGLLEYWAKNGLPVGGVVSKPSGIMQLQLGATMRWKQAISTFGGVMFGMQLPQNVVASADTPFVWNNPNGPSAGGHEVYAVGYQKVANIVLYDLISWGQRYRATEEFLEAVVDEAFCVYDPISLDARGKNAAGIDEVALLGMMQILAA